MVTSTACLSAGAGRGGVHQVAQENDLLRGKFFDNRHQLLADLVVPYRPQLTSPPQRPTVPKVDIGGDQRPDFIEP